MKAVRTRDTTPELAIREILHSRGLRYRLHQRPEKGIRCHADIVFRRARVAVFVDGCFWHCCPEHGTSPKANADWWRVKLAANRARDERNSELLRRRGWAVIRAWEHEDPTLVADLVENTVRGRLRQK